MRSQALYAVSWRHVWRISAIRQTWRSVSPVYIRDTAGALGLHSTETVQYARPEIIGLVLGAFIISVATKEYRSTAGSSPMVRFVLGMILAIGSLVFLGCPLRMIIRMSAGDLNALGGSDRICPRSGTGVNCPEERLQPRACTPDEQDEWRRAAGTDAGDPCTGACDDAVKEQRERTGKYACTDHPFTDRWTGLRYICAEIKNVLCREHP